MTQTLKRFGYIWSIFTSLAHYCSRYPSLAVSRGKYYFIQVSTRSYPMLTDLYKLFYREIGQGKVVKVISLELVHYLDDIALAYRAMDDGASERSGFYLHTKGFSFTETYHLAGMLHYNFNLYCTVQNHSGQPVIHITAKSVPRFIAIVKPYFHSDMFYKLHKGTLSRIPVLE